MYEELYRINILGKTDDIEDYNLCHSIGFDEHKNVFRAWRGYNSKNRKVNYVPFIVTIAKKQYPVKIKMEWWYD